MLINRTIANQALVANTAATVLWPRTNDVAHSGFSNDIRPKVVQFSHAGNTAAIYVKFDGTTASSTNYDVVLPITAAGYNYVSEVAVPAGSVSMSIITAANATLLINGGSCE